MKMDVVKIINKQDTSTINVDINILEELIENIKIKCKCDTVTLISSYKPNQDLKEFINKNNYDYKVINCSYLPVSEEPTIFISPNKTKVQLIEELAEQILSKPLYTEHWR